MLLSRIGVGDDAPAGLQVGDAVAKHEGPDRDARIELTLLREHVAHRATVDAAAVAFELRDDLHRAYFRRARHGSGREASTQQLEGRAAVAQLADALLH